jgi:hypothetical protein
MGPRLIDRPSTPFFIPMAADRPEQARPLQCNDWALPVAANDGSVFGAQNTFGTNLFDRHGEMLDLSGWHLLKEVPAESAAFARLDNRPSAFGVLRALSRNGFDTNLFRAFVRSQLESSIQDPIATVKERIALLPALRAAPAVTEGEQGPVEARALVKSLINANPTPSSTTASALAGAVEDSSPRTRFIVAPLSLASVVAVTSGPGAMSDDAQTRVSARTAVPAEAGRYIQQTGTEQTDEVAPNGLAGASRMAPMLAGPMADVVSVDLSVLGQGLEQFLSDLASVGNGMTQQVADYRWQSYMVTAVVASAVAWKLARQPRKPADDILIHESADSLSWTWYANDT